MDALPGAYREIAVPVSIFGDLREAVVKEAGPLPAIRALHAAGYAAGVAAADELRSSPDADILALPAEAFWAQMAAFFSRRGWGTLTHEVVHEAVGTLTSSDWVEGAGAAAEDASCSFSTGFLSGLLTTLAGGPIAVLEVSCRARGDGRCSFAFGNASAIHDLYGRLVEGADLSGALASL